MTSGIKPELHVVALLGMAVAGCLLVAFTFEHYFCFIMNSHLASSRACLMERLPVVSLRELSDQSAVCPHVYRLTYACCLLSSFFKRPFQPRCKKSARSRGLNELEPTLIFEDSGSMTRSNRERSRRGWWDRRLPGELLASSWR